jgi:hypothetical protein
MTPNLTCPDCHHPARSHGLQTGCLFPECTCKHTYFAAGMLALEAENVGLRDSHKKLEVELAYQEETALPRLHADFRQSLQMVALALGDHEHGWKKEHVATLREFLAKHLEEMG